MEGATKQNVLMPRQNKVMEEVSQNVCSCPHHRVVPLAVVLFGVLFFLGSLGVFTWDFVNLAWPVLVIIAGGTKLFSRSCRCCKAA